jgi:hypothetical protein
MATPKNIFQLVNIEGQNALDIRFGDSTNEQINYCDWSLDGNGHIRTIRQQNAMLQTALKNIFTEKQDNGYGTNIYELIGEKDIVVRRVSLAMDVTMAMLAQKGFLDAQAVTQELSADDLLATMTQLSVSEDDDDPSVSRMSIRLQTNAGQEVAIGVL